MTANTNSGSLTFDASRLQGMTHLARWGVIRAQGEDAAVFLHGQMTQDFALLGMDQARFTGYCSPKGRLLASFIGFKLTTDDILLLCERDLLPQILKRLSMFVLRSKVKLSDASAEFTLLGAVGVSVPEEGCSAPAWAMGRVDSGHWIRLPSVAGLPRAVLCMMATSPRPDSPPLPSEIWNWLEVRSGIAMVSAAVQDEFVPQMLNYESVGAVNFKKGCYPGQEVVARSQYRGVLKRRAYVAHSEAAMTIGQEIFHPNDADQAVGQVAMSAAHPMGGWDAIVSMQTTAADSGALTLGSVAGPRLELLPLPYELLQDI